VPLRPDRRVHPAYLEAFARVVEKIVSRLKDVNPRLLPIKLYVAGGAALHLHTGSRVSVDIDGVFSRRVVIDDNLEASYRDADGSVRMLYFDRNYNDTLGLMHEDAQAESQLIELPGNDGRVVEVRVLTPLDLAVSKLARFSDQDREDIELLAREKLIDVKSLRKRAQEALAGYVGDTAAVRTSIDLACKVVEAARRKTSGK
jgi:hypothetical protein